MGVGEGLDGDGEEVVGVVSFATPLTRHAHAMHHPYTDPYTAQLASQPKPKFNPTKPRGIQTT